MGNLMGTSPRKPLVPVNLRDFEREHGNHQVKPVQPEVVEPIIQLSVGERSLQQLEELANKVKDIMGIVTVVNDSMPIPSDQKEKTKLSILRAEEDVMQQLLKCDNVECDENTRKNRKELVISIQNDLTTLDNLKNDVINQKDSA